MADVAILVPMLGRPHMVTPLRSSIHATVPDARVLWLLTPGDDGVLTAVKTETDDDLLMVDYQPVGDYARKIHRGIEATTEPYLFTGACDLRFHPGWFDAAVRHFADPRVGVVGTNDLTNPRVMAGVHATHFLVRRSYVDMGTIDGAPGPLFFEGYVHEMVDDELVGTAKKRGAWAMALDSHVEHLHPYFGKGEWDDVYRQMGPRQEASAQLYMQRVSLWSR